MKFTSRQDIHAPIERVFAELSDFNGFARRLIKRGAELRRVDAGAEGVGMAWEGRFTWRGKKRKARAEVVSFTPPEGYAVRTVTGGLEALATVELIALSRSRTRVVVTLELLPRTLSARLLVQSLKLTRGTLNRRFEARVAAFAGDLEKRLQRET